MKQPTIYGPLSVSLFLHFTFLVIALVVIHYTGVQKTAVPYIVSLVDERAAAGAARGQMRGAETKAAPAPKTEAPRAPEKAAPKDQKQKSDTAAKQENEQRMRERIEALQAKKRVEKLAALRKIVDVDKTKSVPERGAPAAAGQGGTGGGADYYSLIVSKIRQQWVFPETLSKDLEAVVAIRIARDGRVTVERMEKSSNNALFDRSVLRAIAMASPLPPPAKEMEMGVRFRP